MPYEFIPVTFGIMILFGILAFVLIKKSIDDKNKMKLREMAHQERLKALEQEVPLVEIDREELAIWNGETSLRDGRALVWLRLSALCLGLASTLGGVGMMIAFRLADDNDLNNIWPVGFMPAMIGVGLLLFYALSRSAVELLGNDEPRS